MLNDVEALEVYPHRMGRIGQASVSKSIGRQQITELVVYFRLGNSKQWNQSDSKQKNEQSDQQHGEFFLPCELSKPERKKKSSRGRRSCPRPKQGHRDNCEDQI